MTCADADRLWDEVLDARGDGDPAAERRIGDHTASCPRCRAVAERYRALRSALIALGPPPAPSDDLAARFLVASRAASPRPKLVRFSPRHWIAPAAAASLLAAWLGYRALGPRPVDRKPEVHLHLASALAEATSATIDLARGVSAPAARIGLDVFDLDGEEFAVVEFVPVEGEAAGPASDILRSVGERIDAGARPLSGSARHAFGFLLSPASDDRPTPPGADDGA